MQEERRKMNSDSHTKIRFRIVLYFFVALITVLVVRLYFMQVMSGEVYAQQASEGILRSKSVPAPRGNIYDRNGKLLVKSIPVPAVAVDPRILIKNVAVVKILSEKLNIPYEEIMSKIQKSNISYLDRIILKQDIDYGTMIYLKENSANLPGVDVIDSFLREYEYGSLAAHVLGYTGEIDEQQLKDKKYSIGYEGGDQIGLTGIEQVYEDILRGIKGKITYEVDPAGKPKSIVEETPYSAGNDLYLTIDIDLQKAVEEILSNSILAQRKVMVPKTNETYKVPGGAVVVLSAKTGEILSMASYPTYDPSIFTGGISVTDWNYLNDPANQFPLNNRAIMSYAPGSIFKIVTAYAGLNEEVINKNTVLYCGGVWNGLGSDFPKWCWNKSGHGGLNILGAIQNSCDIFFYQVGYGLFNKNQNSGELLQKYAKIFGLGSQTGVDLPFEDSGVIPDKKWKKEYFKDQIANSVWFPGDSVNMAIGQGDVLATPLQMAQAYSVIVNRGLVYTPHLAKEIKDLKGNVLVNFNIKDPKDLNLNKDYIGLIEKGLGLVTSQGTASSKFRDFPLKEIPIAGKTGTAEVAGKQDWGWFASYAPIGNPEYIVVVMLEQSGGGSASAAPIADKIYKYIYNVK
jgi:penicillin-binding protein 2